MARKKTNPAVAVQAAMVNGAAATAGADALRDVLAAANGHGKPHGLNKTLRLAHMCKLAADHLSEAHKALFVEADEAEAALAHLDAALTCLKDVAAHTGSGAMPVAPRKTKSA